MRRAISCSLSVTDLAFEEDEDNEIHLRGGTDAPEWSDRPVFLRGKYSNYSVMLDHHWQSDETFHYLETRPDVLVEAEDLPSEWNSLVGTPRRIVEALRPEAAFAWTRTGPAENPFSFGDICGKRAPHVLTPWTYYSERAIDPELMHSLRSLCAKRSQSLADGSEFVITDIPGGAEHDLATALNKLPGIQYRDLMRSGT